MPATITFRRVTIERVGNRNEPLAFCPRILAVTAVVDCRSCERFAGLCAEPNDGHLLLRCGFGDGEPVGCDTHNGTHGALPLGLMRAPVSEIMTAPVHCARADTALGDLAAIFLGEQVGAIPVHDATGKPIGIVTKTDAMERYYDCGEEAISADALEVLDQTEGTTRERKEVVALDIMSRVVFSVAPETSISRVAALMAYERVHHVLVVSADGDVRGIASTLDIARWIARADGYVIPRRSRERRSDTGIPSKRPLNPSKLSVEPSGSS